MRKLDENGAEEAEGLTSGWTGASSRRQSAWKTSAAAQAQQDADDADDDLRELPQAELKCARRR